MAFETSASSTPNPDKRPYTLEPNVSRLDLDGSPLAIPRFYAPLKRFNVNTRSDL